MKHLKYVKEIVTENLIAAQSKQKQQYDKKKAKEPKIKVGNIVLLHNPKVPVGLSPKLHRKWDGPFYITAQGSNHTYKLARCSDHKPVKSTVHAKRLKLYNDPKHGEQLGTLSEQKQPTSIKQTPVVQKNEKVSKKKPNQNSNKEPIGDKSGPSTNNIDDVSTGHIEKLVKYRIRKDKKEFRVKWIGYSDRTWEPVENRPPEMVRQFMINKTQHGKKQANQ